MLENFVKNVLLWKSLISCDVGVLFFASLKKKDGNYYALGNLSCIRVNVLQYFMRQRKIYIIAADQFYDANLASICLARKFIKNGWWAKHFQAIELVILPNYLNIFRFIPTVLLHKIFRNIIYYFGTRGHKWCGNLIVSDFVVEKDSNL